MPSLKPDRDKNFGGSLVFDFGQWWRHVKTIYCPVYCRTCSCLGVSHLWVSIPAKIQTCCCWIQTFSSIILSCNLNSQSFNSNIQLVNSNIQLVNSNIQLVDSNLQFVNSDLQFNNSNFQFGNSRFNSLIQTFDLLI